MDEEGDRINRRLKDKLKRLSAVRRNIDTDSIEEHCLRIADYCVEMTNWLARCHLSCFGQACCCGPYAQQGRRLHLLAGKTRESLLRWRQVVDSSDATSEGVVAYELETIAFMREVCIRLETMRDLGRAIRRMEGFSPDPPAQQRSPDQTAQILHQTDSSADSQVRQNTRSRRDPRFIFIFQQTSWEDEYDRLFKDV